jgi:hypothetical protein
MRKLIQWMLLWGSLVSLTSRLEAHSPVEWIDEGLSFWEEDEPTSLQQAMQRLSTDFRQTRSFQPNVGFASRYLWFSIALKNPQASAVDFIFEVAYPRLEILDLYAVNARGEIRFQFLSGTERA